MGEVIILSNSRRKARPRADPEQAQVFPGVSLADLRRVWAAVETPPAAAGPAGPDVRSGSDR